MKKISKIVLFFSFCCCLLIFKIEASTPADFELQGESIIKQGDTVTYKIVVTDGDAILLNGNLDFFNETNSKAFQFVSFNSDIGMIYDKNNDLLYLEDDDSYAVNVDIGDELGTLTIKVKNDAPTGTYTLLEKDITVEAKTTTTTPNEEANAKNYFTTTNILYGVIAIMLIIILVQNNNKK